MNSQYKINVFEEDGRLMYDFANPLLNSFIESENTPDIIVLNNNTYLVVKDHEDFIKGEVVKESNVKNKLLNLSELDKSDEESSKRKYLKIEKKFDDLVTKAEVLLNKPTKHYLITEHLNKMERNLNQAIEYDYYNLQAYYIDLGFLHYKMTAEFDSELSPATELYFLEALKINNESQNSRVGLIQYYLRIGQKDDALNYVYELKNQKLRDEFLRNFNT